MSCFITQDAFGGKKTEQCVDAVLAESLLESHEKVKKDLSALSKEEQMEVVYRYGSQLYSIESWNFFFMYFAYVGCQRIRSLKMDETFASYMNHLSSFFKHRCRSYCITLFWYL